MISRQIRATSLTLNTLLQPCLQTFSCTSLCFYLLFTHKSRRYFIFSTKCYAATVSYVPRVSGKVWIQIETYCISLAMCSLYRPCHFRKPSSSHLTKMASKIIVPADFGIENLNSPVHSNITIELSELPELLVNSLILSYNSPVFLEMFKTINTRILDMKRHNSTAVRRFIESLYTGDVRLEKSLLKDFSELASQYKVAWLILRCHNYFYDLLETLNSADTEDMYLLFEEACQIKLLIADPVYMEQVTDKILSTGHKISEFIELYLNKNYLKLTKSQIKLILSLKPPDYEVFLNVVYKHVFESQLFDDTSRAILLRVDLVRAMEADAQGYQDLFDLLLVKLQDIPQQDRRLIHRLHLDAMKRYKTNHPEDRIIKSEAISCCAKAFKTLKKMGSKTELKLLPSKYHLFQCYKIFKDMELSDFVNVLSLSSEVKSLFMLLEAIDMFAAWENFNSETLHKVISCIHDRSWSKVPPNFLRSLYWLNNCPDKLTKLLSCNQLISHNTHTVMISQQTTTPRSFLLEGGFYKFPFPRPRTTNCVVLSTQCGVLVKIAPLSQDGEKKFALKIVREQALYSAHNMHFHTQLLQAERMHFVVEMYSEGEEDGINMGIAWARGKPEFREEQIYWGGWHWGDAHLARMVLYFDNLY